MSNLQTWAQDVAVRAAGWTHLSLAAVGSAAGLAAFICVLQHLSDLKGILPGPVPSPASLTPAQIMAIVVDKNNADLRRNGVSAIIPTPAPPAVPEPVVAPPAPPAAD